jgi:antigen flippase
VTSATVADSGGAGPRLARFVRAAGRTRELAVAGYLGNALGLVSGPLLARSLGPGGRGELASVLAIAGLVTPLACLGVDAALMHQLGATKNRASADARSISAAVTVGPLGAAAFVLLTTAVLHPAEASLKAAVYVLAAALPMSVIGSYAGIVLTLERRLRAQAITRVLPFVLNLAGLLGLLAIDGVTVASVLLVNVVANVLPVLLSLWIIRYRLRRPQSFVPLIPFGIRSLGATFTNVINVRLDQVLLVPLASAKDLGLYAVAVSLASLPILVIAPYRQAVAGRLVGADGRVDLVLLARSLRHAELILGGALICAGIVGPPVVPLLFGHRFDGSVPPFLLLLPGIFGLGLTAFLAPAFTLAGMPGRFSVAQAVGCVVTAVGLPVVVPRLHAEGAALVSTAAYTAVFASALYMLRRAGLRHGRITVADLAEVIDIVVRNVTPRPARNRQAVARRE